ncbi:MAG TPA: hypothetical protein VFR16_03485, partial [Agromyces mariniharenae]|nr:hypothetical protein [Agromyces mariniharenae]
PDRADAVTTDAARPSAGDERAGAASDELRAALDELESQPLADRAPGYLQLAEQLRAQLEESDPARGTNGR